ncbi:MAG: ATP-binding protein [Synechococcaceae cyanobacterium]
MFDHLPRDPATAFRLAAFGTVLRMLERQLPHWPAESPEAMALAEEYRLAAADLAGRPLPSTAAWADAQAAWQEQEASLPANRLKDCGFGAGHLQLLLSLALVEEDPRLSLLIEPAGGLPTLGGRGALWREGAGSDDPARVREELLDLVDAGLVSVSNQEAPRCAWQMRTPVAVVDALSGQVPRLAGLKHHRLADLPTANAWIGDGVDPQALGDRLRHLPGQLLIVRGPERNGRSTLVKMVAARAGLGLLEADARLLSDSERWRQAGAVALLAGALILIRAEPAPGETVHIPQHSHWSGPLAVTLGHVGSVRSEAALPRQDLSLALADAAHRGRHWRAAGVAEPGATVVAMAVSSGVIHRAAAMVGPGADEAAVMAAIAAQRDARLDALASRIDQRDPPPLFLDRSSDAEFQSLLLRCRHREALAELAQGRGVKALFSGPSGTGKTLAARKLAHHLGKDLFRIDLAATVNKYIGETEKSLERALSAAEALDIVLLLDEGDALMARRTDVSNANDRYANLETNFLLQRLESFAGILVVTTNDANRIDSAFSRRMDAILAFRAPDELRRLDILQQHLGQHQASAALLDEIACRCSLNGGQLRNIALHCRLLALESDQPPGDAQLRAAVLREYRKSESHCPLKPALAEVI